jgi:acyl-coenzyme A thioesterase PaaI-like protein
MEKRDYFREFLGIKGLEVKEGYAKMSMKVGKEHTNFVGSHTAGSSSR